MLFKAARRRGRDPEAGGAPEGSLAMLQLPFRDRLVRFVITNVLIGMAVGCAFAGLVLYFDIGGLWRLISRASNPYAPLALLFGSFMITFGSIVCGTAIMLLPKDDDPPPPRGGKKAPARIGGPAPVRVAAGRSHARY
jgi:hypothetical protein